MHGSLNITYVEFIEHSICRVLKGIEILIPTTIFVSFYCEDGKVAALSIILYQCHELAKIIIK